MNDADEVTRGKHARHRTRRILGALALGIGFLFAAFVATLVWALETGRAGEFLRQKIVDTLRAECAVSVEYSEVDTEGFFPPEFHVTGLQIHHLDGQALAGVEEALLSLRVLPLFYGRIELERIALLAPRAAIQFRDGRITNLPACMLPDRDDPKRPATPLVVGIRELVLERGRFDLALEEDMAVELGDISVSILARSSAGADVAIAIDEGKIASRRGEWPLDRVRVRGHIDGLLTRPRTLTYDDVTITSKDATMTSSGTVDLVGPVFDAHVALSTPLERAQSFFETPPKLEGAVRIEANVVGTLTEPRATGRIVVTGGRWDGYGFGDEAIVEFRADGKALDIPSYAVRVGEGRVTGRGRIAFNGTLDARFEAEPQGMSLARVLEAADVPHIWADLDATGRTSVDGTLAPVALEGPFDFDVRNFSVFDRAWDAPDVASHVYLALGPTRATGRWRWDPNGLEFIDATVASGASRAHADVRVDFKAKGRLRVRADLPTIDFSDLGPIAHVPIEGIGHLTCELGGPYAKLAATGTFDGDRVAVSGMPLGRVLAHLAWHDDTELAFTNVRGRVGRTNYGGAAAISFIENTPMSIDGTIERGQFEDVLAFFGVRADEWGHVASAIPRATFRVVGPVRELDGTIDAELEQPRAVGEAADRGRFAGRLERGTLVADNLEIRKGDATLFGRGRWHPTRGDLSLRAHTEGARLSHIDALSAAFPRLDGTLEAMLAVEGSVHSLTGTASLALSKVAAGPRELGDGRFRGSIAGTSMSVRGELLHGAVSADGTIEIARGLPYSGSLGVSHVDVPSILAGLAGHTHWKGRTSLSATLNGSLVDWEQSSGDVHLGEASLEAPSLELALEAPADFRLKRGRASTVRPVSMIGPRTELRVHGDFGRDRLAFDASGRADLAIAEILSPAVERAGGTLRVQGTVGGTPDAIALVGNGSIRDGFLQWRGVRDRLTGATAELAFNQSTVFIERAEAKWANGTLRARGDIVLDGPAIKDISLAIDVVDVHPTMNFPRVELSGALAGQLEARRPKGRILISGDLAVTRGRASLANLDIRGLTETRTAAESFDPESDVLDVDIGLDLTERFRIRSEAVNVELSGALRLTGTNQRWGMLGTVNVVPGGRATFILDHEIERGMIEFRDRNRFLPHYDLVLHSSACGARLRTNVVGMLGEEPRIDVTSNRPELSASELRACLLGGSPRADEFFADGTTDDDTRAASRILWVMSGLDKQVKKVIQLDQIELSTEYSSREQAYETRVLVAKEILEGRVRLEYSSSLAKKDDQRAAVRWKLTPRLTLDVGWASSKEVDYGDFGVDLERRWEW